MHFGCRCVRKCVCVSVCLCLCAYSNLQAVMLSTCTQVCQRVVSCSIIRLDVDAVGEVDTFYF